MAISVESKYILEYPQLNQPHAFIDGRANINVYVSRQIAHGLPPEDAIEQQAILLQQIGMDTKNGWIMEGCVQEDKLLEVTRDNYEQYRGYSKGSQLETRADGFDAVFTRTPGIILATGFGDCPQLLIAGPGIVGMIHANRRTLGQNIIASFMQRVSERTPLASLRFGLVPHIRKDHFFHSYKGFPRTEEWLDKGVLIPVNGGYMLDLTQAIVNDLLTFRIDMNYIYDNGLSTFEMADEALVMGASWLCSKVYFENLPTRDEKLRRGVSLTTIMLQ